MRNVTFSVREGASVALVGASGSGKTTLARCIAGLVRPDSGSIRLSGRDILPLRAGKGRVPGDVQMVFQGNGVVLNPMLTVRKTLQEAVTTSVQDLSATALESKVIHALDKVGLPSNTIDALPRQLSGGQRQLVAIARALQVHPRLLILDEPTSALDPISKAHVLAVLNTIHGQNGVTVILVTHDISVASALCSDCVVMDRGEIVEQGTLIEMAERPKHPRTKSLMSIRSTSAESA